MMQLSAFQMPCHAMPAHVDREAEQRQLTLRTGCWVMARSSSSVARVRKPRWLSRCRLTSARRWLFVLAASAPG